MAASSQARSRAPIFIVGTERSGSNLLRLILVAHPDIAIPHPPHLMRYLAPLAASYGDLRVEANRRPLVTDAVAIVRRHLVPWEHDIDAARVLRDASPSVFGVVAAIHEQYREAVGATRWACKSTFNIAYVSEITAEYPDARFVWLVRDPRDVAASAKGSVFGPCEPLLTAQMWAEQQAAGLAARACLGPGRVHLLRYESLVGDPGREIAALAAFLDVDVRPEMLAHELTADANRIAMLSASWRNLASPISAERVGRHQRLLSQRERRDVEFAAGTMMAELGYVAAVVDAAPSAAPVALARNAWRRFAVEVRSLRHDINAPRRLARDALVQWIRVKALVRALVR